MKRAPWTDIGGQILRKYYSDTPTVLLAAAFKRQIRQVYATAKSLGMRKSPEFLAGPHLGRTDGTTGESGRFQKGLEPWNKGTHHVAGGRSAETRFKPGSQPY